MNKKKVVIVIILVLLIAVIVGVVVATSSSTAKPASTAKPVATAPASTAPASTAPASTAPASTAPASTAMSAAMPATMSADVATGGGITFVQITRPSMNPGWYPYGATANFVKSTIGVTNLESAIAYARANGYSAFSFNESSTSTDPVDINSKILFFTEPDINLSTFFTSGAAVSGFKVYAARDGKLKSSETFAFNTPQYLRHLQNKNYLL